MPLPALAPAIPWILGALGGGTLWAWVTGNSDEWADADVFNSRMRQIHTGILQLQNLIAKCPGLKDDPSVIASWRSYMDLWSKFYSDIGTVTFAPSDEVITEARSYASTLAKWLDTYKEVCGTLPTGLTNVDNEPRNKPTNWANVLVLIVMIGTGGYVFSQYLKNKR